MKITTNTMDNTLNMNNIRNLLNPTPAFARSAAIRLPGMAYVPGSWLEAAQPSRSQKAARSARPAPAMNRSIWMTLPQDNLGEKVLLGLLVLGAAIGISYGFSLALDFIQSSPALHSLALQ